MNAAVTTPTDGARRLTHAECHAIGNAIAASRRRPTFDHPARKPIPRPTMTPRRHPDLTAFLFGFLALLVALFLITVFSEHVQARAAETVAQGIAKRAM
ncbi:MAG: hypothetical protein V7668_10545 [Cereibacter changlensis]